MELLERVESSYVPAFKSMLMDVEEGEMLGQLHHIYMMTSGPCSQPGVTGFKPNVSVMALVIWSLL